MPTPRPASRVTLALAGLSLLAAPGLAPRGGEPRPIAPGALIQPAQPPMLLVDTQRTPRLWIAWTTAQGQRIELAADSPYTVDAGRLPLGENIAAFTAVGGTRLTKGAGHPQGAVVRVGFYKLDNAKAFFRDLGEGGQVEVRVTNIAFNQPVDVHPESIVQHLKYSPDDLASCGMPGSARDQFNTASPGETLNDLIDPEVDARLGALSGQPGSRGSASAAVEPDGTVSLVTTFAYPLLRHLQDPWQSELPGTFLEPMHFHIEFEALPAGVPPLDTQALRQERQRDIQGVLAQPPVPLIDARTGKPIPPAPPAGGQED